MADLKKIFEKEIVEKSGGRVKLITPPKLTKEEIEIRKKEQKRLNAEFQANENMRHQSYETASHQFLKWKD